VGLPAEIDEAFELALVTTPPELRSWLVIDSDTRALPKLPMASQQAYQGQMRNLLFYYMTQPGFGERELTDEEKDQVTPFEVGLWNFCKKFRSSDTDFTERKWLAEMLMGPVVQRNENVNLNVNQDWKTTLKATQSEVAEIMAFAQALEADITDAEEVDL
jgi:hypothetical protein